MKIDASSLFMNLQKNRSLMKQKKYAYTYFSQLKQIFNQELPELVEWRKKPLLLRTLRTELLTFSETCDIKSDTAETEARANSTLTPL